MTESERQKLNELYQSFLDEAQHSKEAKFRHRGDVELYIQYDATGQAYSDAARALKYKFSEILK